MNEPLRASRLSAPSFALSIGGMLLLAVCHVGFAAAIYHGLQAIIPLWGAIPITLLCYWILRNVIVTRYRKRIRRHFWLVGEGHRSTGRIVSTRIRSLLDLLVCTYGDPLGAYAEQLDFIDSMEVMARPEVVECLARGVPPPPVSFRELYGIEDSTSKFKRNAQAQV